MAAKTQKKRILLTLLATLMLLAAAVSLWMIHLSHNYATRAWKNSPTILAVTRLPPRVRLYSNTPKAIELHDHRPAGPLPTDAAGWNDLFDKLAHEDSFLIWFNSGPPAIGQALASDPRLEHYRQLDDGIIYRADASIWAGGARTPAFNPQAPSTPVRRNNPDWMKRHYEYVARAKQGNCDLLFLGDSITDDFRTVPGAWEFFQQRYARWRPVNFGIDHDRTQHLLWRIQNGECDVIHPKVAVILIGTNNSADDAPAAIAKGVETCVRAAQQKLPGTKILLLDLFPRGGSASDKRPVIQKVNAIISRLDNGASVRYLDLYDKFLDPGGTLSKEVMYDGLHPSLKGYHIWADAMEPLLEEMMKSPATAPAN